MNDSKKFSLGGFPPIYEIISSIKKKEKSPITSTILPIQSILGKRINLNNNLNEKNKKY